jgi:2,3,4,5-tetrahydropyridine-2,6-dicarboxylate N-succinyltransferase
LSLSARVESLFTTPPATYSDADRAVFFEFRDALNAGAVRAAEPDPSSPSGWRVNRWVKQGILLGFRLGGIIEVASAEPFQFFDKSTYPLKKLTVDQGVRIVPGGSSVRDGAYLGRGVTCMPPKYNNVGAYVGDGTMVDSHALIGSCAQIGRNCHISAASQIGGVLEPVGALPVIIEDEVLVGGNCGIYEGVVVKERAVIGSGTVLNASTPIYDVVREQVYRSTPEAPLIVPAGAVVVAGSRRVTSGVGVEWGVSLYTPVIVKYRDAGTDSKVQLEDLLR